jgi:hypothetical protein
MSAGVMRAASSRTDRNARVDLHARIAERLEPAVEPAIRTFAERLAHEAGALAVLFYGSNLRTGSLDGVLDFYILMPGEERAAIWPAIAYRECDRDGETLRAKVAIMSLSTFEEACAGGTIDTTIWTRFVQPSALVWVREADAQRRVIAALGDAAVTAARLAATLGPPSGTERDFWRALFRATYEAEFRIESSIRPDTILDQNWEHFDGLLPLALAAGGFPVRDIEGRIAPDIAPRKARAIRRWWKRRARLGKPLNLLRLGKASTTFDGAARYAAWKIARHTGLEIEVTPFREKYPLLAAPAVWWAIRTRRRKTG